MLQLRQQSFGHHFEGPLHLEVTFYFAIPKSRDKKLIQGTYHYYRPDLSNLIKFLEDIATGILFDDDCIISSITSKKCYDDCPRTEFIITELEEHG